MIEFSLSEGILYFYYFLNFFFRIELHQQQINFFRQIIIIYLWFLFFIFFFFFSIILLLILLLGSSSSLNPIFRINFALNFSNSIVANTKSCKFIVLFLCWFIIRHQIIRIKADYIASSLCCILEILFKIFTAFLFFF